MRLLYGVAISVRTVSVKHDETTAFRNNNRRRGLSAKGSGGIVCEKKST